MATVFSKSAGAALLCVLAGGVIGASTNAVNGYISPGYFRIVLGWDFQEIWAASIAQGIVEGLLYGVVFAIVLLVAILLFNREISRPHLLRILAKAAALVYLSWVLGGVVALLLAWLSPDFYRDLIRNVPVQLSDMLRFAWVGGSIQGGMYGGLLSAIITAIAIRSEAPQVARE